MSSPALGMYFAGHLKSEARMYIRLLNHCDPAKFADFVA